MANVNTKNYATDVADAAFPALFHPNLDNPDIKEDWVSKSEVTLGFLLLFETTVGQNAPPEGGAPSPSTTVISELEWVDTNNNPVLDISGLALDPATFKSSLSSTDINANYNYFVSILAGDITITDTGSNPLSALDTEVGSGGTATINGSAGGATVWVWHQKNVIYNGVAGASNYLEFAPFIGTTPTPSTGAIVNLGAGTGTNPYGGTLTLTNVTAVIGTSLTDTLSAAGLGYSVSLQGGNSGDDVLTGGNANDTIASSLFSGNDTVSGGAGDDTISMAALFMATRQNTIDGGGGRDTVYYNTSASNATVTHNADQSWTVALPGLGETDTLRHVELLQFSDKTIAIGTPLPRDFGADGRSDILFRNASGTTYLYSMNDNVVVSGGTTSTQVGTNWQIKGIGDFNGDGAADLLFSYYNASNSADPLNGISYVTLQNGAATTSGSGVVQQLGPEWSVQGVGDFDGDGKSDVLYRNANTGFLYLDIMNGHTVTSASGFTSQQISDPRWQIAGIADFDGDGHADLLWRYDNASNASDPLNGVIYEWAMNGTNVVSQGLVSAQPGSDKWSVAGTGDFDGNGTADILFRYNNAANASDPLNGFTYIDFMNGTQVTSGAPTQWQVDNSWAIASIGDFNGDGKSDLLFQHAGDNNTYIWDMNGTATTSGNFTTMQSGPGWTVQNGVLDG